ncbi:efflux RND transporter periplasmic adaptor subunit [Marinobacter zhejiangensis]|nr:HlyD family efflux transporter periplasmic adaptor subunit [Marinobacter zhejiangensis]
MRKRLLPVVILAIGIAGFLLLKATRPAPQMVAPVERSWRVDTLTVNLRAYRPELALYGEVQAPELMTLAAPVAARVAERPVHDGQWVAEGDLLVALEAEDLEPLLAEAEADVLDLNAQLRSENIRNNNDLKALENEQAIVANAERQLERTRTLVNRNLASQDQLESAVDVLAKARLTLTARQRALDEHGARRQSLQARLARAEARLEATRRDLRRSEVVAPFNGVVTRIGVAPGDQVSKYQSLLAVYPIDGLELRAQVPNAYRDELAEALVQGRRPLALSTQSAHEFEMQRFAGESDPAGTEAIFRLVSDAGALRPGAMVPVVLQRPELAGVLAVPYSALYGNNGVYVVSDDQRMRRLQVEQRGELLQGNGERWALIAGPELVDGLKLIVTHLPNAIEGLKVEIAEAADA